jgi:IS30 family transposase
MAKYTRFSLEERIKIEVYRLLNWTLIEIGKEINRSKSSIRRDLSRFLANFRPSKPMS